MESPSEVESPLEWLLKVIEHERDSSSPRRFAMWRPALPQQKKSNKINAHHQKFLLSDWKPLLPFFEGPIAAHTIGSAPTHQVGGAANVR
jgi:hypothetical protein